MYTPIARKNYTVAPKKKSATIIILRYFLIQFITLKSLENYKFLTKPNTIKVGVKLTY